MVSSFNTPSINGTTPNSNLFYHSILGQELIASGISEEVIKKLSIPPFCYLIENFTSQLNKPNGVRCAKITLSIVEKGYNTTIQSEADLCYTTLITIFKRQLEQFH